MKIIFVRPRVDIRWMVIPPLGLGYLAAAAKKAGHEVVIYDAWLFDKKPADAARDVYHSFPDIIGIQVFYDTVEWTRKFINEVRSYTYRERTKIIVGGPSITANLELAHELGADEGIAGEGEYLWHGSQPFDVNSIPMPDWDSFDLPAYWPYMFNVSVPVRGRRPVNIQRTRGCSSRCTFCAGHITHGYKLRIRDDDNVLAEIEYLKSRWNIDEVWFQDDNFIANYHRGLELFRKLAPLKLHIRLPSGIRWENVDAEMAQAMKEAGVYYTGIGIESGNERVLARIRKSLDLGGVRRAINILDLAGILTNGFFILGLPTETREEMKDTVRFALSTRLNHAQFGTFISYPGSEDEGKRSLLAHDDLIKIQRNATLKFYLRPRIMWGMIKHFRWSQLRAFKLHPWIRSWIGKGQSDNVSEDNHGNFTHRRLHGELAT